MGEYFFSFNRFDRVFIIGGKFFNCFIEFLRKLFFSRPKNPKKKFLLIAYRWIDTSSDSAVPSSALRGGVDIDGQQIYVGRAYHEGDWMPAKVIPGKNVAYVAYGGQEHAVHRFQVRFL